MSDKSAITTETSLATGTITTHILVIRNHKALFDTGLANLYGVPTKMLVQAFKRNADRFSGDFMFQLDAPEWAALRTKPVTSNTGRGGRRYAPYVFTEQGVAMLSPMLGSAQAIALNIESMRAFLRLREMIGSNKELALRLDELESKADLMEENHDTFKYNTRVQLKQVFDAIRELMTSPEALPKRLIGFVTHEDASAKPKAAKEKNNRFITISTARLKKPLLPGEFGGSGFFILKKGMFASKSSGFAAQPTELTALRVTALRATYCGLRFFTDYDLRPLPPNAELLL